MNDERFSAIKCLIGALCIGALFTLAIALIDRADAKRIERVTKIYYQEAAYHVPAK